MPETVTVEKVKRNKGKWTKLGDSATYTAPSGASVTFDFSKLPDNQFAFYGKKQWLSDDVADEKVEATKLETMKLTFNEAVEKGVTLSPEGRLSITGKERGTSSAVAEAKALKATFTAETDVKKLAAMKLLNITLTPEQEELLKNVKK